MSTNEKLETSCGENCVAVKILREFRAEVSAKLDGLHESVRALNVKISSKAVSIVADPNIQLPEMPIKSVAQLEEVNEKLCCSDAFMEQMVIYYYSPFTFNVIIYFC